MKLEEITTIRSGLVLRRKEAKPDSRAFGYQALNLRSIDPEGCIDTSELDVFNASEKLSPDYLTRSGDVVIRLSAPYTAVLIDDTTSGLVITSNFIVVRADETILLPDYLAWLLNTAKLKKQIYESATSNMLSAVNAKFYANLDIVLLSMEEQRKIAELHRLARREIALLRQLTDAKEKYYAEIIDAAQRNMRRKHKP